MAKSGPFITQSVIKKNIEAAKEAKANDPFSQSLTQGRQTQGQSAQVRLLAAYQTLRSALVSSTATSPETFRQAQQEVRNDQKKRNPDKKIRSISVKQIDDRIVQLQQVVVQQNAQQAASGTVFSAKEPNQNKTGKQQEQEAPTPPEIAQQTISLEIEDESESSETQADQDVEESELSTPPSKNKPSLPPIAPKPEPIRVEYITETRTENQTSPFSMQDLPQPGKLKQQVEMIRMFNQARTGQMPGGFLNQIRDITTSTQELISGFSGGSIGPGAVIPGGALEVGATSAGGIPAGAVSAGGMSPGAAAQGARGLISQLPKLASALKAGGSLAAILSNPITLTVIAIVLILIILVVVVGGGGGNVANLVPTNEFLPLGTGSGEADPNVLYGDAIPIDVENPCWPVGGEITQLPNLNHGTRCGNKGVGVAYHQAIDIATSTGTRVYAPYAGDVCVKTQTAMGSDGKLEGYGVYLVICTDLGFDMVFAHLADYASGIKQGDQVTKGQLIAFSGDTGNSTGPHLHFEITNYAVCRPYNILDIVPSIPASNQVVESCSQYLGSELQYEPI